MNTIVKTIITTFSLALCLPVTATQTTYKYMCPWVAEVKQATGGDCEKNSGTTFTANNSSWTLLCGNASKGKIIKNIGVLDSASYNPTAVQIGTISLPAQLVACNYLSHADVYVVQNKKYSQSEFKNIPKSKGGSPGNQGWTGNFCFAGDVTGGVANCQWGKQ